MTHTRAYQILGLNESATADDIKAAFRKLAVQWHPDKCPNNRKEAEEKFREILEAKDTLLNKDGQKKEPEFFTDNLEGIYNAFNSFFAQERVSRTRRGEDLHHVLHITLEEAIAGCIKRFEISRLQECSDCRGRGGEEALCEHCKGQGHISQRAGYFSFTQTCISCGGYGAAIKTKCQTCHGEGRVPKKEVVAVELRPATEHDAVLIKHNFGHAGRYGGRPGNFYLHISVLPHHKFERIGDDLKIKYPIPFSTAVLGGTIEVPTLLSGNIILHIPAGTQIGTCFRVPGKGVKNRQKTGDQIVEITIEVPQKLTEKQKKLLQEFSKGE
jgi:molecular chaperone DnaJ